MATLEELKARRAQILAQMNTSSVTRETPLVQSGATDVTPTGNDKLDRLKARRDEIMQEMGARQETVSQLPMEWSDVGKQALTNIPRSGIELMKNIWSAVTSPIETGKAVGGLGLGAIEQIIPGEQSHEEKFDQFVDIYKNRYGGVENLKKTIANDPVGIASELAGIFGGGSAGLSVLSKVAKVGKLGKTAGVLGAAAKVVGKGSNIDLVPAAIKGTARGVSKGVKLITPKNTKISLIKTALQPTVKTKGASPTFKADVSDKVVKHLLDNGDLNIDNPTKQLLKQRRDAAHVRIESLIDKASEGGSRKTVKGVVIDKPGLRIPAKEIVGGLDDIIDEIKSRGVRSDKIDAELKFFVDKKADFIKRNPDGLSVKEAQAFKKSLNRDYDASDHIDKLEARLADSQRDRIMKFINDKVPGVKELNAESGVITQLRNMITDRIENVQRKGFPSLGVAVGGGASTVAGVTTGILTGSIAAGAGAGLTGLSFLGATMVMSKIFQDPNIQLWLARYMQAQQLSLKGKALTAAIRTGKGVNKAITRADQVISPKAKGAAVRAGAHIQRTKKEQERRERLTSHIK